MPGIALLCRDPLMWIIITPTCPEHNLIGHERWLRPGTTLSLGRDPRNDIVFVASKSVSKQHVSLTVSPEVAGSSLDLDQRSVLSIVDHGSKFGTHLKSAGGEDEIPIQGQVQLKSDQASFRLGKAANAICSILWRAVVFTMSNIKLAEFQAPCDALDAKMSKHYDHRTTHVVTDKYNTSKALQALVLQKHIVGPSFITALHEQASALQSSMASFPDPCLARFLPNDVFSAEFGHQVFFPKVGRETCFKNLTFCFFTIEQCKSLTGPIVAGGGEAILYEDEFEARKIQDFLQPLKKPIIIPPVKDETRTDLLDRLSLLVGCVSINQGQFIHVILSDGQHEVYSASRIKVLPYKDLNHRLGIQGDLPLQSRSQETPLNLSVVQIREAGLSTRSASVQETQHSSQDKPPSIVPRRIIPRSFKPLASFDDDLFGKLPSMPSSRQATDLEKSGSLSQRAPLLARTPFEPVDLFESSFPVEPSQMVSNLGGGETRRMLESQTQASQTPLNSKKRPRGEDESPSAATPSEARRTKRLQPDHLDDVEEEEFEAAPTAAAFEKLRSHTQPRRQEVTSSDTHSRNAEQSERAQEAPRAPDITEEQILHTLRANKERIEQETQVVADDDGIDSTTAKNLGTIEFFPVDLTCDRDSRRGTVQEASSRWKESWNGRKNFKRFRRATRNGVPGDRSSRSAIMIRLVESKPSDRATADMQWLESSTTRDAVRRSSSHVIENDKSHMSDRNTPRQTTRESVRSSAGRGSVAGEPSVSRKSQSLFVPDDSESDDDPLRFRL